MISARLNSSEFSPYYEEYINNAANEDILQGLRQNLITCVEFYSNIQRDKHDYAYAEGKWTVKEVLLHIIDTERIFAYRALRIARNDATPMAGFEQDDYIINSDTTNRSLESLIKEYKTVRAASISLFESLSQDNLMNISMASNSPISARAIGYIITGHENHHNRILEERYL